MFVKEGGLIPSLRRGSKEEVPRNYAGFLVSFDDGRVFNRWQSTCNPQR